MHHETNLVRVDQDQFGFTKGQGIFDEAAL
jgi:hypothetical protein